MLIWKVCTGQIVLEKHSVLYLLELILNYKVESKYWFFGALFACYLAMPVFSLLCENRPILWYVVGVNFFFSSCLPVVLGWIGISWNLNIAIVSDLIIYVLLGYLLSTQKLTVKQRRIIYFVGIFGTLFRYVYTYVFSVLNGTTDVTIKGYRTFHAVFLGVAVFELAKNIDWKKYLPDQVISKLPIISSCSFGVYLIHAVVMYYEQNLFQISKEGYV